MTILQLAHAEYGNITILCKKELWFKANDICNLLCLDDFDIYDNFVEPVYKRTIENVKYLNINGIKRIYHFSDDDYKKRNFKMLNNFNNVYKKEIFHAF
jgi:hypothetical protein